MRDLIMRTIYSEEPRQTSRRRTLRAAALTIALVIVAAACGGAGSNSGPEAQPAATAPSQDAPPPIRLALPSEPLWQWLVDSGELAQWEKQHGMQIEASHPFRPFTAFVSGHADVILIDALDIPAFAQGFEIDPVIIGKYAADRSITATKRTSLATDMAGVVEGEIAVDGDLGSTLLWALIVEAAHGLDLSYRSPDFDFFIATFGIADAVESGNADACICLPDESVAGLSSGTLRPLYNGASAARLFAELSGTPEQILLGQIFLVDRAWLEANPEAVRAFLNLWERAVRHWHGNYAELIGQYPELLSVQSDEEIAWLIDYVAANNWITPSVYPTQGDADAYAAALDRLRSSGLIESDARTPLVSTERLTMTGRE
ncbi:hypothetical protein [Candidatus Poriferisodalis sp.]|uniref:hypothetical protein n=1 Tax=Candidatus Poriferisodalis sp. TaxID=3101277 RepID=UPI003AF62547